MPNAVLGILTFLAQSCYQHQTSAKKLKFAVSFLYHKETLARFKDIWERAERGEKIEGAPLETISFENAKLLMKILSPRRLELLQQLHTMGKTSIRALAKKLNRDYSNVHEDVKALHHIGLILRDSTGNYYMPWDKIVTEIPMDIIPVRERVHHPR